VAEFEYVFHVAGSSTYFLADEGLSEADVRDTMNNRSNSAVSTELCFTEIDSKVLTNLFQGEEFPLHFDEPKYMPCFRH